MSLNGKKILIGISGGIAAYKICDLVRLFKKSGAEVKVVMTPSAANFVSPVTLSTLSGNEVLINIFPELKPDTTESIETKTWHINAGMWADVYLIAPATANTLAKITQGFCDNFLTAIVLAARCPVILAPSMDEDMFKNEITGKNISSLKERGYFIIEPETGELASGLHGVGRMPEPQTLFNYVSEFLKGEYKDYSGKKVLVTAGPTYEPIDDVRFIGNYSSGKMGFQVARAAALRGAEVTLISGPSSLDTPRNVKRINVKTSDNMYSEVQKIYLSFDYIVMSAAVADYKPGKKYSGKIKKDKSENLVIETERTVDILEFLGKNKNKYKLAGFALELENEIDNAKKKLKNKNLDLIVVNNPKDKGAGFDTDTNKAKLIDKNYKITDLQLMSKFELANKILDKLIK